MSEKANGVTYVRPPKVPTLDEAKNMEKILIGTVFEEGEYIAEAIYNGTKLKTTGYSRPYAALQHLINVIIKRQQDKGLKRDLDYMFMSRVE